MEGNRYPDTSVKTAGTACVWIPVTFHDFFEVFFSCYCGHTLNAVCAYERAPLSQAQTVVQGVTTVTGEEHLREVMESNRYPDTCSSYWAC